MKVLITGATGKFGPYLLQALLGAGHSVRALVRSTLPGLSGVEHFHGDITRADDVRRACEGAEAVCHLATVKGDREKFLPVNLGGLLNLLEGLRQQAPCTPLIHLSGDNVLPIYDYETKGPLNEKSHCLFVDDIYGLSKMLEETLALQYARKYGLNVTLLRGSWIMEGKRIITLCDPAKYGMKRYLDPVLSAKLAAGEAFRIYPVDKYGKSLKRRIADPRDLCAAFLHFLNRPAPGEIVHIASPAMDYRELAEYLSSKDNLPIHAVAVPGAYSFEISTAKARRLGFDAKFTARDTADWALAGNPL